MEIMQDAMEAAQEISANIFRSVQLGHLAAAYGRLGRPEIGVDLLQEAIGIVDNTDERFFEAELHRFRGEILIALGKADDAEAALQRAMAVARIQDARLWELRAAASLARLWSDQGRKADARWLLAPVYDWFTEGLATADLKTARLLLEELGEVA
jgi:predicted ATPase